MTFELKYTQTFYEDLDRLADFLIEHDPDLAERAINAIQKALMILQDFPLMARRASADDPLLRELVVPFGSAGYVILFKVMNETSVIVLAVRHQREEDYH
ncbi:type II toxin-antitoxin system RelE/ParE family toxin [Rhizobium leguminosarum bv. viciae 248]|jgi:plasmid stabilization system protein ParE|uniref:type II toxin-antitoxin system RelE/ParE family toxin n=1 Tax=Rhizobium leguminosarum TaxID=384 RepID=UPI00037D8EBE|nr:type II toxin-antitoxin system RelE/ParE family toxin [Rhizobium leguminosarum]MBY5337102.1 type II toxin-antitoxin system RelE/ParE family toxin [Rhizobium leguminosarum]MBY5761370.1 type II toxin-antitoxin system RelE/ParE family toxin [Rhizobium leguminosarum]MCA2407513.1 type II toxin-antitoxin system RelE/ParE family toxin [Rhizobium leguminosarum]NKL80012.1 type II toxin-antitoxin system RelE/ParE family toxin [Rhizobium leguminosarum bv. viciae]NKM62767.1 type II toxin-antitoxin syst